MAILLPILKIPITLAFSTSEINNRWKQKRMRHLDCCFILLKPGMFHKQLRNAQDMTPIDML